MSSLTTVRIQSLSHDGRGITSIDGKTTFVSGALPTEEVRCTITKKHSRYMEAHTTEIITPSSERTQPICRHVGICGGCSMQHMTTTAQIQFKQHVLLEQLKHFGQVVPKQVLPPITGQTSGYRRKARLGVRYVNKKGKLLVGFREKNSRYLADIEECPVLHASIGTKITALSELIQSLSQYEQIPQIETAVGDSITALVFRHLTDLSSDDITKLCAFGDAHHFHIYLQPNPPAAIHKIWPEKNSGLLSYTLPDYQLEMVFHPLDFTQVNHETNSLLIQRALQLLEPSPDDHVLDLFCGLGNFTLPIARYAKSVIGVEGSQEMVERAEHNAKHNGITNAQFYMANLMETSIQTPWFQSVDKIVLDPPRAGAKEIISLFSKRYARRIVYVSCNPATLARDAGSLVYTHHYQLKQVGVMNMFPHTNHIEAIALFEK